MFVSFNFITVRQATKIKCCETFSDVIQYYGQLQNCNWEGTSLTHTRGCWLTSLQWRPSRKNLWLEDITFTKNSGNSGEAAIENFQIYNTMQEDTLTLQ